MDIRLWRGVPWVGVGGGLETGWKTGCGKSHELSCILRMYSLCTRAKE